MTKTEMNERLEMYVNLYNFTYKVWQDTGAEAAKQEAAYFWQQASKLAELILNA